MLISHLDLLATAPGGVARLRELILTLAVQGKLVPQDPDDEPASELLKKIRAEKDRLIAEGKVKQDKPMGAIAVDERLFALPTGWEWMRLAEVALPQAGFAFKSSAFNEVREGLPLIRIRDVGDNDPTTFYSGDYREEFIVEPHDWLISMDGEFRVREWSGPRALLNQRVTRLMFYGADLFKPFVTAALQFKLNALQGTKAYTTVDHLSGGQISSSVIALPPLTEQSRIVTRVEELMRLCDALEAKGQLEATQHAQLVSTLLGTLTESETPEELAENWQRIATHFDLLLDRPEAVDALEQTILQLAVRGLLVPQDPREESVSEYLKKIRPQKDKQIAEGRIKRDKAMAPIAEDEQPFALPHGWGLQHLNDVVEMLNGYAFKSEWFRQMGVRLLRNLNVSHGYVDWSQAVAIDATAAAEFQQFALRAGDIVLSLDRPIISTGLKYAVIRESDLPCLLLQRVARMVPDARLLSAEFLALWLQSDLFVQTIDPGRSNGVPHISTRQVGCLVIALPPLDEQSRIVARVAQLRSLCSDLRQRLTSAKEHQSHLAQSLVEQQSTATV